jgi:hypothetical protein
MYLNVPPRCEAERGNTRGEFIGCTEDAQRSTEVGNIPGAGRKKIEIFILIRCQKSVSLILLNFIFRNIKISK